jgi:hypothetical protein
MSASGEKSKSLPWMISVLMLAIAAMGWGFAASDYAIEVEGVRFGDGVSGAGSYRGARGAFFRNAFAQIPNAPQVISHTLSAARWVLYVFGGLEVGAVLLGIVAWRVERGFSEMENKYKKKKKPTR